MLRLVLRNILRQKVRSAITLAAISFGVTGLVLTGGFVEDIFVQLREATIHSQLGHIQVYRKGYLEHGRQNPYDYLIADPGATVAKLAAVPHVSEVLRRVQFSGLASTGRAQLPIVGEGVEPDKEARLGTFLRITAGRQLADADDYSIIVGQGVAGALGLEPGDTLTLLVNTPDGALNSLDFEVVGVFRTFSKDYDDRAVRIPLAVAQELLATPGVHSIVLALDETAATDAVAARVGPALANAGFEMRTWYQLAEFYQQTVDLYRRQFGVLELIILVMVLLSVVNSVNMAIYERTGEFGTLMALGKRGKDIFRLIVTENALMGIIGASLGILLGIALALGISRIGISMPPPPNSNSGYTAYIRVIPVVLVSAFLVGVVATTLASLLPARRASRLPIAEALRENV